MTDGFTCEPWGEFDKKIVAARAMLKALKRVLPVLRYVAFVEDEYIVEAIKQAEEAGITTGEETND